MIMIWATATILLLSGCKAIYEIQPSPSGDDPHSGQVTQTMASSSTEPALPIPIEKTPALSPSAAQTTAEVKIPATAISTRPYLRGINIANALEAPEPGLWGVTIQKSYLETIAAAGFNAVRIPARFSAHTNGPPDYGLDPDFLEIVDQAINWGLEAGLIVILDFHGFEEMMRAPSAYESQFFKIWQQLSGHYQHYPETLWLDILNEPSQAMTASIWNDLVETSIRVIRKTNPTRKILVGGVNYSTVESLYQLDLPSDPNLIAVFHFYTPFEFTHQGAEWVPGASSWLGTTWEAAEAEKSAIRSALDLAVIWSHQNQTPILMEEFGVITKSDPESRRRWISFVANEAENRDISWLHWGFCSNFGIYDCEAGTWNETILPSLNLP